VGQVSNSHQLLSKFFIKISADILASKFWNIGIGGRSNIGSWPNINEKKLKVSVLVSVLKIISVGL